VGRLIPAALLLVATVGFARLARDEILHAEGTRAADALPLYLAAAAVADGTDPTTQEGLAAAYDRRGVKVGAATFSTLYPASAGVVLQPFAVLAWASFETIWRWGMLVAAAVVAASAGVRARSAAWGAGLAAVLAWHPLMVEAVRLGQVNLWLGALGALAVVTPGAAGGALLAVGALIKVVPGAGLLPFAAARRWGVVVSGAVVGLAGLAVTAGFVPLARVVSALRETLAFQAAIDPDWLVGRDPAPDWMRWLGFVRHDALQWIALGLAVGVPAARPSLGTARAGLAVLFAWLGADAAGFHILYTPLAFPVLVLVAGRPVPFVALAASLHLLARWPESLAPEPRMVLWGFAAFGVAVSELAREASAVPRGAWERDRELRGVVVALAGLATGGLVAAAPPGDGPVAAPLPEGVHTPEGAGFIHANDRVPGETRALGAGVDRAASTLVKPGTVRDLQLYLRRAPHLWRELAERYPAQSERLLARARAAPSGELRDLSGREVGAWLREERAAVEAMQGTGLELGVLPAALAAAEASGL
jgi:hypothetical protein